MDDSHDALVDRLVALFRALGDPTRLRLLGLVAERNCTGSELAAAVTVGAPTVSHHMEKLVHSGLVTVTRAGQSRVYSLDQQTLQSLARLARGQANTEPAAALHTGESSDHIDDRERSKVLRDFFEGERLKQNPAQRKKRVIVLQHLVGQFEPNRDYTEREVSESLKQVHPDFATLRRELIDYGYMTREGGVYRVAQALPERSAQVRQEISGDESEWLRRLLASTVA